MKRCSFELYFLDHHCLTFLISANVNVPEKTKLLLFHPKGDQSADYWHEASPIIMDGAPLPLSPQADHVGILRCPGGSNLPSITARIAAHTKSLYSVISCGMARSHRGNPAASLRVETCYSAPKLFSGLATLLLSPTKMSVLSVHRRLTLQRLQRLHPALRPQLCTSCLDPSQLLLSSTNTSLLYFT